MSRANYRSVKRVVLPCWMGDVRVELSTDVVELNLPLLISKQSMKKGKLVLDLGKDLVKIKDRWVKLMVASSGHYMLPLYL